MLVVADFLRHAAENHSDEEGRIRLAGEGRENGFAVDMGLDCIGSVQARSQAAVSLLEGQNQSRRNFFNVGSLRLGGAPP